MAAAGGAGELRASSKTSREVRWLEKRMDARKGDTGIAVESYGEEH